MVKSMTAFAIQDNITKTGSFTWELRTVNHRFLDISLYIPDEFRALENEFRTFIKTQLKRGKMTANLRYVPSENANSQITVNIPLAKALMIACQQIESLTDKTDPVNAVDILQWPGVAIDSKPDLSSNSEGIIDLLEITLRDLIATREREGQKIAQLIEQRCDQIAEIIMSIRKRRPAVLESIRHNILTQIQDIDITPDAKRLEQELVFYMHKLDIDEELDRIMAHLDEISRVLEYQEPMGRRLDFLMQELNRETNTLGAKSNDIQTTQASVDLKVLIEQMREQIQNIE